MNGQLKIGLEMRRRFWEEDYAIYGGLSGKVVTISPDTIRDEVKVPEVSVIITDQPCVLVKDYHKLKPFEVIDDKCTGCGNCTSRPATMRAEAARR